MTLVYRYVCSLALAFVLTTVAACGEGGDGGAGGGTIASVAWDPVIDPTVVAYTVHYGKQSSGSVGSCDYEHSVDVTVPATTIAGLEFNAQYYFAISAFNGSHSSCSAEVAEMTPSGESNVQPM